MPCRDSVDQSLDEMVSQLAGALADPKAIVVPDADCIEMLWPLGNGVGARVCTAVRIKQDRFSIINWKAGSGQRPSAADVDPPFAFAQLYRQPEAWLGHRRAIRSAWRGKSSYDQCRHRRA